MKVLKRFYSNSRKKSYTPGEYDEDPLKEWIDEGLVEKKKIAPEKKSESSDVAKKEVETMPKKKTRVTSKSKK